MNEHTADPVAAPAADVNAGEGRAPNNHHPAQRALMTLNAIGDGVVSIDVAGNVTYLNPMAEGMTGWSAREAVGLPIAEVFRIIHAGTRATMSNPMLEVIKQRKALPLTANCVLIRRDGFEYAIEDSIAPIQKPSGEVEGAVMVFRDVSAIRARMKELAHLAHHDALTGLPNMLLLRDRLGNAIALARRHGKVGAVLFVDLDRFKWVNDSMGHPCGDELLVHVARRLVSGVRRSDTVCRVGGDEFVVLLAQIEHAEDANAHARGLLRALSVPCDIEGNALAITASIGISLYPGDGADVEGLIRNADIAMYQAKQSGGNAWATFMADMDLPGTTPMGAKRAG